MFREEITQIAMTVWEAVLALPLEPGGAKAPAGGSNAVKARISFSGAWEGDVVATLSEGLSRRLAGAMLQADASMLAHEDVQDALKEIINMLGGNIKALLPPPCRLSLPLVTAASTDAPDSMRGSVAESVHFACGPDAIEIRLRAWPAPSNEASQQVT